MVTKRDRLEVMHDILKIIKDNGNSIKPTPLLRYSNLSFNSYANYHVELIKKGLIKETEDKKGKKFITLTDRGFSFIDKYKLIKSFLTDFDLE